MRLPDRLAERLPARARLGNRLVGTGFVLTPDRDAGCLGSPVGLLDGPLFSSVFGSTTRTTPLCRFRSAVPVGHQVRVRWYELPASRKTRRIVVAPTRGSPARRSVRSRVLSDQVAVPSVRRSGGRWAVATIRARATGSYVGRRPRPAAIRNAATPSRLNRRTRFATVVPLRRPAACAACANDRPSATADTAVARCTRSSRSPLAFIIVLRSLRSDSVSGRKRSCCMVVMLPSLSPCSIAPNARLQLIAA